MWKLSCRPFATEPAGNQGVSERSKEGEMVQLHWQEEDKQTGAEWC